MAVTASALSGLLPGPPVQPEQNPAWGGRRGARSACSGRLPQVRQKRGRLQRVFGPAGPALDVVTSSKVVPIWLGSSMREEPPRLRSIRQTTDIEFHQSDLVATVDRLEAEVQELQDQRKYILAAVCLEQAISLRRKLFGDQHQDLLAAIEHYVLCCNLWGNRCLAAGHHTQSLELLKKAELATEADNVPSFRRRLSLRAATFNNLCCYFRHRGKLNAALQFAERALRIEQRYKDAEDPARTHLNYAVLLSMAKRHEQAVGHLETATAVLHDEDAAGDGSVELGVGLNPVQQQRREDLVYALAVAYYNMWVELKHLGRREASLDAILRAANIARRRLGPAHSLTAKVEATLISLQDTPFSDRAASVSPDVLVGRISTRGGASPSSGVQVSPDAHLAADILRQHGSALAVLADLHQVTLRENTRSAMQQQAQQMEKRKRTSSRATVSATPPDLSEPLFESRPRLESMSTRAYTGSPILQQQAYGMQPLTLRPLSSATSGHDRVSSTSMPAAGMRPSSGCRTTTPRQLAPLEPRQQPEELRAAYEYHLRQEASDAREPDIYTESARLDAIDAFRARMDQRRGRGLPLATAEAQERAGVKIQALFRGYSVRLWTREELAKQSRRQLEETRWWSTEHNLAYSVVHTERRAFVEHSGAVRMQRAWRGWVARRDIKLALEAIAEQTAARLQAQWRRHRAARSLGHQRAVAVLVQKAWRGRRARRAKYMQGKAVKCLTRIALRCASQRRLRKSKQVVVPVQGVIRGFLSRVQLARQQRGALAFQTEARGWLRRRRYQWQRAATTRVAAHWRGHKTREEVNHRHMAARRVQRCFRRHHTQLRNNMRQDAAAKIAAVWRGRGYRRSRPYGRSACKIQARLRGVLERESLRQWPVAAVRIQAWWRGMRLRWRLRICVALMIAVQRLARTHLRAAELDRVTKAVLACQRRLRGYYGRWWLAESHDRAKQLQAFWRRVADRQRLMLRTLAAQKLQTAVRRRLALRNFRSKKNAATIIQAGWAQCCACKKHRRLKLALKFIAPRYLRRLAQAQLAREQDAARRIQRRWRRHCDKKRQRDRHVAATQIQKVYRVRLYRKRFVARCYVAAEIQALWRRHRDTARYCMKVRLATSMQAAWRGWICRQELQKEQESAVVVQRIWRKLCTQRCLQLERISAKKLQALVQKAQARKALDHRQQAAVRLQCLVRGGQARLHVPQRYRAALILQAAMRGTLVRRFCRRQHEAAVFWQKHIRRVSVRIRLLRLQAFLDMYKFWYRYKKRQRAIDSIQRAERRRKVYARMRLANSAATHMQRIARSWHTHRRLKAMHHAATIIQAHWLGRQQRRHYLAVKRLQRLLASQVRRRIAEKEAHDVKLIAVFRVKSLLRIATVKMDNQVRHGKAILIQRQVRALLARRLYKFKRTKALLPVQRAVRMRRARVHVERLRWHAYMQEMIARALRDWVVRIQKVRGAVRIQAYQRMVSQRRWYLRMLFWALPKIQGLCRVYHTRKEIEARRRGTGPVMQRALRVLAAARQRLMHRAASMIQKNWRHHLRDQPQFNNFLAFERAAIRLQTCWRCHHGLWVYRKHLVAVVRMQALVRCCHGRRKYLAICQAVRCIQASLWRPYKARQQHNQRAQMAVKLQASVRMTLAQWRVDQMHKAAIVIQSKWRRAACLTRLDRQHSHALQIQNYWRLYREHSVLHPERLKRLRGSQALARGLLVRVRNRRRLRAAKIIQQRYRFEKCLEKLRVIKWLILAIQRIWRAHSSRIKYGTAFYRLGRIPALVRRRNWLFQQEPARTAAATQIQRTMRGRRCRHLLQRRVRAAMAVQAWWRSFRDRHWYLQLRAAAYQIQALCRRKRGKAEVGMKRSQIAHCASVWAMKEPMEHRRDVQRCVRGAQKVARGNLHRRRARQRRSAVREFQRHTRGYIHRELIARRRSHAHARIQAYFDGYCRRKAYVAKRRLIIQLQAYFKMWITQRNFKEFVKAQTEISRRFRGYRDRRNYGRLRATCLVIARCCRCWLLRTEFLRMKAAAECIQIAWLFHLDQKEGAEMVDMAVRIQAFWRMSKNRRRYLAMHRAGIILVGAAFMWRHMRFHRQRRVAATTIACFWRGHACRRHFATIQSSIVKIQRWWGDLKTYWYYREFAAMVTAERHHVQQAIFGPHVVSVQRWWRRKAAQKEMGATLKAVMKIQAHARRRRIKKEADAHRARIGIRAKLLPSLLVTADTTQGPRQTLLVDVQALSQNQRARLGAVVAPLQYAWRMRRCRKAMMTNFGGGLWQRLVRQRLTTIKAIVAIQSGVRGRQERVAQKKRNYAALEIQAFWRSQRRQLFGRISSRR